MNKKLNYKKSKTLTDETVLVNPVLKDTLYLLYCAVSNIVPDKKRVKDMKLDAVFKLADRHKLAATVAYALEIADIQHSDFIQTRAKAMRKEILMDAEMATIFEQMSMAGIWHLPLKGAIIKRYYPSIGVREMTDRDILFDASRAKDLKDIMEDLGYSVREFGKSNHDIYHKPPVLNFEMHRTLFKPVREADLHAYYKDIEKRLLGDGYEKHLSPEDFYLYLLAHEYKHYTLSGTGLRSLLDTYVFLTSVKMDREYLNTELAKLKLTDFEKQNSSLVTHLFREDSLTDNDAEMLNYILSSGIYGTYRHRVWNKMKARGWGRFQYILNRFLVPINRTDSRYEAFSNIYPVFYRFRILLPLLPIYRLLIGIGNGRLKRELTALKKTDYGK